MPRTSQVTDSKSKIEKEFQNSISYVYCKRKQETAKRNLNYAVNRLNKIRQRKVDRVTANHSLSSTGSQGTSNIPFPCFLVLGCNRQAQDMLWRDC